MNKYRTKNCEELGIKDVGKTETIAGWIATIRDLGGVIFLDLRDQYGVTQCVTSDEKLVNKLSKIPVESTISITGEIKKRAEDTINKSISTGEIEINILEYKILGKRLNSLPFEVNDTKEVREDLRLQYRFLDLRSEKLKNNILLRAKIIQFLRKQMTEKGFTEVQTPILTSSSPEGARDYLVPSRVHQGKFYALPQAPQQFKQLLMVSGIDRYFQIAPCFRDEDARADRAPRRILSIRYGNVFCNTRRCFWSN
jgi:aspartyl-tRNA synthetase